MRQFRVALLSAVEDAARLLMILGLGLAIFNGIGAHALQLDWNGQFWFEQNWLNNYQLSRARPGYDADSEFINNGSPYVPGTGEKNSVWYDAFLKLKPKAVVNDSINIRAEFQVGSPTYPFMGRGFPGSGDERFNFTGSQKDGLSIVAARYWAQMITDFGTIELGRAPLHWGLGAIWNSGDNLFDHYQSTVDTVRLTSKFGNFSIQPAIVKIAMGGNVSGASNAAGNPVQGNDDITDYDLAVKYDNSEEDFEFGMMWTKRTANAAQRTLFFNPQKQGSTRMNFNVFDFFARKKWGRFSLGGELPLFNGNLGALDGQNEFDYKTVAVVVEGGYTSDVWDVSLKAGHVPGQPPTSQGDTKFRAVFLNKDYKLGLIMFNYNLYGLSNNNPDTVPAGSLQSPYDNEIVNANYFALTPQAKVDKWTFHATYVFGWADQTASAGHNFYNYNRRQFYPAIGNQSSFLGWEMDYGVAFKWDENFILGWDLGLWFPGSYYSFSNSPGVAKLDTDSMFASRIRAGITF
jgi:hypothetical protein